jgi:predicted alpha/beta-hydrolase family hydrolase
MDLQSRNLSEDEVLALNRGICPDCGGSNLLGGPSAGLSQNVGCTVCGSEFAYVAAAPVMSTRNSPKGKPDRERIKSIYGIEIPE